MRIAFRLDASARIGTGHWMRSLTLAKALRARGDEVVFISRDPPAALRAALPDGIALDVLPPAHAPRRASAVPHADWLDADVDEDAQQTLRCIVARWGRIDWLVIDHYALDAGWHRAVRAAAGALLVMDDLADRPLDADIVLDETFGRRVDDYRACLQRPARVLAGAQYALLRDEFAALRDRSLARRLADPALHRVLISFGGVDAAGFAIEALRALADEPPALQIDIVLGAAGTGDAIRGLAATLPQQITVSGAVSDMAQRMVQADLAFGACGLTVWERACLGLPTIAVPVADNQRFAATTMGEAGAMHVVTPEAARDGGLRRAWRALRDDAGERQALGLRSAQTCDGQGVARVIAAIDDLQQERPKRAEAQR